MDIKKATIDDRFYQELIKYMENGESMSTRQIYSIFPEMNPKTLSWRLYKFVQCGQLQRAERGHYSLFIDDEHNAAGYNYMQKKSQAIYDIVIDYGYDFYITGLDSLRFLPARSMKTR